MKFEYEITDGDCVEKKTFGGQNLKKKDKLTLAHGKVCVCCVRASSIRQTQALPCA